MAELHTRVGGLSFKTPIIAASGTFGYGTEYDGLIDWDWLGGVSVKGLSSEPSDGHPAPRMAETAAGMVNAIGLQNIGVERFATEKLPTLSTYGPKVIANCWGNNPEEYEVVVGRLDLLDNIDAIELNLACPNKREWDKIPSADPVATEALVRLARAKTSKPLWAKLTPNVADIRETARAAENGGADAISLINTFRAMVVDIETRRPELSNRTGGLSGPAIKPVAILMTYEASKAVDIPIVGGGGIVSGQDAAEFLLAGASAVQVGTATLFDPRAPELIARELEDVLDRLGVPSVEGWIGSLIFDD